MALTSPDRLTVRMGAAPGEADLKTDIVREDGVSGNPCGRRHQNHGFASLQAYYAVCCRCFDGEKTQGYQEACPFASEHAKTGDEHTSS
jgi:hypothetical protein